MIRSYNAFNSDSIDSSQVYLGSANKGLISKLSLNYDLKWDTESLKLSFKSLCKSLINIHREVCVMDDIGHILELITETLEKLKIECLRIGAVSKTAELPKISPSNLSMKFSLQQIAVGIKTIEAFYNSLVMFFIRYKNEPFDLMNYVNMNRVGKAERLLLVSEQQMKKLEKFSYLLRFHSIGLIFVCAVRWIKRARISLPKRINQTLELDQDSFKEVNFPKTRVQELEIDNQNESAQEPLFSSTNENKPDGLWPASPINNTFTLDVSLNSTITNFVSNIPKTLFTPGVLSKRPEIK
jgi:hypothetical protein